MRWTIPTLLAAPVVSKWVKASTRVAGCHDGRGVGESSAVFLQSSVRVVTGPARGTRKMTGVREMKAPMKLNAIDQEHLQELYNAAGVPRDEPPYTPVF